jgi:hypothetical protein
MLFDQQLEVCHSIIRPTVIEEADKHVYRLTWILFHKLVDCILNLVAVFIIKESGIIPLLGTVKGLGR